jgi:hypothetical protein
MQIQVQAQPRPAQNHFDIICQQRLFASNFAQKQNFRTKLIQWVKGSAQ